MLGCQKQESMIISLVGTKLSINTFSLLPFYLYPLRLIVSALLRCKKDPNMSYWISLRIFQFFSENRNCFLFWIPELPNSFLLPSSPEPHFSCPSPPQTYILIQHSFLGMLGSGSQSDNGIVCISDNTIMTTWSHLWPCHAFLVWGRRNSTRIKVQRPWLGGFGKVT